MTMNGVIALILRFSPNSIALLAKYISVVEYRPIMSINIVSQFQSSTLQRSLSATAELLVLVLLIHHNVAHFCLNYGTVKQWCKFSDIKDILGCKFFDTASSELCVVRAVEVEIEPVCQFHLE